jgi:hypothetical protein
MSDFFTTRKDAAAGVVVVSRDDTPVMIRMRYISSGTVTSVTPTTATNLVTVSVEASGTVTNTYTFATLSTVGKLIAAINADGLFQAVALDSLLSDATTASNIVENTAITAGTDGNGVVVYDLHADTSVNKFMTTTLSLHRNFDVLGRGHRVKLQEIVYNVDVNAASANAVRVYQRTATGVETQLIGYASVDVTKTTINWASGAGTLTGADNSDLIVRVQDATSVSDTANNFVSATGLLE